MSQIELPINQLATWASLVMDLKEKLSSKVYFSLCHNESSVVPLYFIVRGKKLSPLSLKLFPPLEPEERRRPRKVWLFPRCNRFFSKMERNAKKVVR